MEILYSIGFFALRFLGAAVVIVIAAFFLAWLAEKIDRL